MPIINSIKNYGSGVIYGGTVVNSNVNAACAAGNTTISLAVANINGSNNSGPRTGLLRVKTEPGAFGVNAQVRVLNVWGDDGNSNVVQFYAGDAFVGAINMNIDEFITFNTDQVPGLVNINVAINVLNATTNITAEVYGVV